MCAKLHPGFWITYSAFWRVYGLCFKTTNPGCFYKQFAPTDLFADSLKQRTSQFHKREKSSLLRRWGMHPAVHSRAGIPLLPQCTGLCSWWRDSQGDTTGRSIKNDDFVCSLATLTQMQRVTQYSG